MWSAYRSRSQAQVRDINRKHAAPSPLQQAATRWQAWEEERDFQVRAIHRRHAVQGDADTPSSDSSAAHASASSAAEQAHPAAGPEAGNSSARTHVEYQTDTRDGSRSAALGEQGSSDPGGDGGSSSVHSAGDSEQQRAREGGVQGATGGACMDGDQQLQAASAELAKGVAAGYAAGGWQCDASSVPVSHVHTARRNAPGPRYKTCSTVYVLQVRTPLGTCIEFCLWVSRGACTASGWQQGMVLAAARVLKHRVE